LFAGGVALKALGGNQDVAGGDLGEVEILDHSFVDGKELVAAALVEAGGAGVTVDVVAIVEAEFLGDLGGFVPAQEFEFD
jgi:hypothetical protein